MKSFKINRGFTLVELLAVIAILGIIFTIAALSFSSISNLIKQRQKENLISKLQVAAQRYVSDTGIKKVYIETLITEGLVESDNESNKIYDPITKDELNCYYFDYTDEINPSIKFNADDYNQATGTCKLEALEDSQVVIKYCVNDGCNPNLDLPNAWITQEPIYLGISSSTLDLNGATYTWSSPLSPSVYDNSKVFKVNLSENKFVNDVYQISIIKDGKTYLSSKRVKIDAKNPEVYDISVSNADFWRVQKIISATIKDNGSKLKKYKVTQESNKPTAGWVEVSGKELNINKTVTESGNYYIWVQDTAGNTYMSNKIHVDKIQATPPANPSIIATDGIVSTKWHSSSFRLKIINNENVSPSSTYYWTDLDSNHIYQDELIVTDDMNRVSIFAKTCSETGLCSSTVTYKIMFDAIAPSYVSGGLITADGINFPEYQDNTGGIGGVQVYVCLKEYNGTYTGGTPTYNDSCFVTSSRSYEKNCNQSYSFFSYAEDALGNKSNIKSWMNEINGSYYHNCYLPPDPDPSPNVSYCDATCQMKMNSYLWWVYENSTTLSEAEKQKYQDELHKQNQILADGNPDCNGECTFKAGDWFVQDGDLLYGNNKR